MSAGEVCLWRLEGWLAVLESVFGDDIDFISSERGVVGRRSSIGGIEGLAKW
jgi:hypothetical protein